jgi:L-fuconolactonase
MGTLRKSQAGVAGLRLNTGPQRVVWSDPLFLNGGYSPYFALAEKHELPIFLAIAPRAHLLAPYAKRFPGLKFIIDHMGLVSADERPAPDATPEDRLRGLDRVAELAEFSNVSVKWAHIERLAATPYPYRDVIVGLRRLVDVLGANRLMWASDATETARADRSPFPSTWSQALHHVSDSDLLTAEEKTWVLGRTARAVLKWPA